MDEQPCCHLIQPEELDIQDHYTRTCIPAHHPFVQVDDSLPVFSAKMYAYLGAGFMISSVSNKYWTSPQAGNSSG